MAKQSMVAVAVALLLGAFATTIPPKGKVDSAGVQSIGVCYGRMGDNLPAASDVVQLYKANGIESMRIYDTDPDTLQALDGSGIGLVVGISRDDLVNLASSPSAAAKWVQDNVAAFPGVSFRYIAVGNEAVGYGFDGAYVLPALRNLDDALSRAGLRGSIKASTVVSSAVVTTAAFLPSTGNFFSASNMTPIARYLASTGAPLLANLYPYFAYVNSRTTIDIDYALFKLSPARLVVRDGDYNYTNLFDALVDAFYWALERAGAGNVTVVVSETGWPSAGGDAATATRARTYNQNLISHVTKGTPKRPGAMEAYIFAMFNENMRPGADLEQNFGLFNPDKSPAYPGGSLFAPTTSTLPYPILSTKRGISLIIPFQNTGAH
ncbi:unnamed protein product [Urochloa decumbens]|uniref:Glucan endo-1,3-beta-D-glucosidase n=1 Tax=Urochloa decumbens TaxID=240449 RepID=A0ABC8YA99_9POAL